MNKGVLVVVFLLVISATSVSAADIGFYGIGGKAGLVMPDAGDNTLGFGVLADLGTIIPNLGIEGCVDYWGNSYDTFGAESSFSIITIGPTVKYHFPLGGNFAPFVGGGVVLALSRVKIEYTGTAVGWMGETEMSESDTDIDIPIVGGISLPIGSGMKFIAEARYMLDAEAIWLTGGIMVKLK